VKNRHIIACNITVAARRLRVGGGTVDRPCISCHKTRGGVREVRGVSEAGGPHQHKRCWLIPLSVQSRKRHERINSLREMKRVMTCNRKIYSDEVEHRTESQLRPLIYKQWNENSVLSWTTARYNVVHNSQNVQLGTARSSARVGRLFHCSRDTGPRLGGCRRSSTARRQRGRRPRRQAINVVDVLRLTPAASHSVLVTWHPDAWLWDWWVLSSK